MANVAIIDGGRTVRKILQERLEKEGHVVAAADNIESAETLLRGFVADVIICDAEIYLPTILLTTTSHLQNSAPVIIIDNPSIESAVASIKGGAFDYLPKPVDMPVLIRSINNALQASEKNVTASDSIMIRRTRMIKPRRLTNGMVEEIVGVSKQIECVKRLIDKVAPSEARVLITGANGTGKELVARWLHEKSPRSTSPFVEVNCAAIPSELIESELFGHEKGSFTSAIKQRKGKFEQADGGTLFLDEIGDMSLSAQAKVLRVLQEHRISRVGGDGDITVNVRVVAATNKNLQEEINNGKFREDLYHRLSVIVIAVPPLNERKDDIPLLIKHFIGKICAEYGIDNIEIEDEAIDALKSPGWSGNIRELRNVVERLMILSENNITLEDVKMYAF